MVEPEPLPVIRVEKFDGSHEHPVVRGLREEIERLQSLIKDAYHEGLAEGRKAAAKGYLPWDRSRARRTLEQKGPEGK